MWFSIEDAIAPFFSAKQTLEPDRSARVLWASVYGICALESQNKLAEDTSARELLKTLIDVYLKGLKNPSA